MGKHSKPEEWVECPDCGGSGTCGDGCCGWDTCHSSGEVKA